MRSLENALYYDVLSFLKMLTSTDYQGGGGGYGIKIG